MDEIELKSILEEFSELFDGKLGKYNRGLINIEFENKDVKPIYRKPHTIPFALREKVKNELERLEKVGIITKIENSEWGTPIVPVLKSGGGIRICSNYNITINPHLKDYNYLIPREEEMFAALVGGEEFTVFDMSAAYNQFELTDDSKRALALSTPFGNYLVDRLSFGTKPACSLFQEKMENVLMGLKDAKNFFDDIIVTGEDRKKHLANLKAVLERIKEQGLKLNKEKCKFFQFKVEYLGHVVDRGGIKKDPKKVEAILNIGKPTNVAQVQSFVGMVMYYAKFMPTWQLDCICFINC